MARNVQLPLLATSDALHDGVAPRNPAFTAATFCHNQPDDYQAVVKLLREGCSHKVISDVVGCSRNTIAAVYRREFGQVEQAGKERELAASELVELSALSRQRVREILLDFDLKIQPQAAGVLLGILQDKVRDSRAGEMMGGLDLIPSDGVAAETDAFRRLVGDAVRIAAEIGFGVGARAAKGEPAAVAAAGLVGVGPAAGCGPVIDVVEESVASESLRRMVTMPAAPGGPLEQLQ